MKGDMDVLDFIFYEPIREIDKRTGDITYKISPDFKVRASRDLMIRGGDFYAVYDDQTGLWCTDEDLVLDMIDEETKRQYNDIKEKYPNAKVVAEYTYKAKSGLIDKWHKYVQKQMRDHYHQLDTKIIFANDKTKKTDYASKKLDYDIQEGDTSAYDELMNVLYDPDERTKIEWAIGSILTGDSKTIQKFIVLYGSAGTGKSTVLNIIQKLFTGYYSAFDAKSLGNGMNQFSLEAFQSNPLVAIQHDGDLSHIEDNTKLNSIVSHEKMTVNVKFRSAYEATFDCFLFMGTNKPVRITDAKSGILRRLIDVSPTGKKVPVRKYEELMSRIDFELGAIAWHCREVYLENPKRYETYIPLSMMGATNDTFNFVEENYHDFLNSTQITLTEAYKRYKLYCEDANVAYPLNKRAFKEEFKNYFNEFKDRSRDENGNQLWNVYSGLKVERFIGFKDDKVEEDVKEFDSWLSFGKTESLYDELIADCKAQYATKDGIPKKGWDDVKTTLFNINTHKLHYVLPPSNHIVIDFDIKGADGEKSFRENLIEASKWPPTYAELSKSGNGIHLHYIYDGDTTKLKNIYSNDIEIKTFNGKSALRRMVSKCNDIPVAKISSGLPLKEAKMVNWDGVQNEKILRSMILKNLNKGYHAYTKPSIDYIAKLLQDAYDSGMAYDVSDLKQAVIIFANNSSNNAEYCLKKVADMPFKSEDHAAPLDSGYSDDRLVFYDVEVFPNLFLISWKYDGAPKCTRMYNPTPKEVEDFIKYKLVGFNCRRYDNHMLYAKTMGYSTKQLFNLSQKIINSSKSNNDCFFANAYNLSYTDVYDFCSKKQSLKKWEIELGIHHQELGLPWDQDVPEELWEQVGIYCDYDVEATEATFHANKGDWDARRILTKLANKMAPNTKSTYNTTTNTLTARIIFGDDKHPQSEFVYTDLSKEFPGYKFDAGKSTYRGIEVGEGGLVIANPGMYGYCEVFDVASMHPHSAIALNIFGDRYTKKFKEVVDLRIFIKHHNFDEAKLLWDGLLNDLFPNDEEWERVAEDLAYALKIAINSVYGLTSAKFDNAFKDPRNKDNIVAKRGALFMVNLYNEVISRGYKVIHIKTDSIKVENPDDEIREFINAYGAKYGYTFEVEDIFKKVCLVNDAVFVAQYLDGEWHAVGDQFAKKSNPYVFKKLFSKESIEFKDLCETMSVSTALYLDFNEDLPDVSYYEKLKELRSKSADKLSKKEISILESEVDISDEQLDDLIASGHNYKFVGKVGQFTPVLEGSGGGLLVRFNENTGKYNYAGGAKGYRWMESEVIKGLSYEDKIDHGYFIDKANKAIDTINKFGDFYEFAQMSPD